MMVEFLQYAGRGARLVATALACTTLVLIAIVCLPFFSLGWIGYRLGWID